MEEDVVGAAWERKANFKRREKDKDTDTRKCRQISSWSNYATTNSPQWTLRCILWLLGSFSSTGIHHTLSKKSFETVSSSTLLLVDVLSSDLKLLSIIMKVVKHHIVDDGVVVVYD